MVVPVWAHCSSSRSPTRLSARLSDCALLHIMKRSESPTEGGSCPLKLDHLLVASLPKGHTGAGWKASFQWSMDDHLTTATLKGNVMNRTFLILFALLAASGPTQWSPSSVQAFLSSVRLIVEDESDPSCSQDSCGSDAENDAGNHWDPFG